MTTSPPVLPFTGPIPEPRSPATPATSTVPVELARHDLVPHPNDFLAVCVGPIRRANVWVAEHLALVFGATAAVYAFMIVPLVVLLTPQSIQNVVFYLASGWIQLWALPLLTYIGNKAETARAAKADADHVALTSVHTTVDAVQAINSRQDERLARIEHHLGIAGEAAANAE